LQLTYRSEVVREAGAVRVARIEEWSYLVRELQRDGVAILEGNLTGVGADVHVADQPLPRDRWQQAFAIEQERSEAATLELGIDGQIAGLDTRGFSRSLRHRALGLRLPTAPAIPGEEWEDIGWVRSFGELLPARLPVRTDGTSTFTALHARRGATIATVTTQGRARAPDHGHSVVLHGTSEWNADRGLLEERHLQAVFLPPSTDPIRQPGGLSIHISLV